MKLHQLYWEFSKKNLFINNINELSQSVTNIATRLQKKTNDSHFK